MEFYVKNGVLVSPNKLNLGFNSSFLYGINAFEGVAAYRNVNNRLVCFMLPAHLDRLENSAKVLGLNYDNKVILDSINLALGLFTTAKHVYLRVILYDENSKSWMDSDNSSILIQAYAVDRPRRAVSCSVVDMIKGDQKVFPPEVKCGANYANSRLGKLKAQKAGFDLPIFKDNDGFLTESGGAALILSAEGDFWTYPWNGNILKSITAKNILANVENKVNWQGYPADNIISLDGACLVGTALEVVPIKQIDHKLFSDQSNAMASKLLSSLRYAIIQDQNNA